ncbi:MAG TPA: peptidylprolyl isomerase [Ignavibacteria bacterium]|nr:peptidylprolyl isomerase [Ignavibacteria bacterium]HRJ99993.1 peptidylprolyl isomerase [Ignavibacteria bacterium]
MTKPKVQNTGIMNKMRDKMPLIIIILIIAFLATIVFEWGMNYMGIGGQTEAFGKINDSEISYQDFERIVQQQIEQQRQQNPETEITDANIAQIRDQVWNSLVNQSLTRQAIEKYGITVSDREILDWIYNRPETLPDQIKRNFMDSTGVFNSAFYQQALGMKTPEATQFWSQVENYVRETLLSEKLQAVISEGAVVTEGDVLQKYRDDNIFANIDYVLLDYNTVTDSSQFAVTDEDMKKYYEENKYDFVQNESVRLKYLNFADAATAEDSTNVKKELERYKKDLETLNTEDSSLIKFINDNSSIPFNGEFQKTNAFGQAATDFLFKAKPGDLSDVLITDEGYQIIRLLDSKDTEELYTKATHILVNTENDSAAAYQKALDLYNRVKNGEDISQLAFELSDDPSAKQNRGDLGWFGKGAMVAEFETAVNNTAVGDVTGPVYSKFGFHIIKVFGKEKKEFKIAQVTKPVQPSSRSKSMNKKKADDFYAELEKGENIDSLAKRMNVQIAESQDITRDGQIPLSSSNKKVLNFSFDGKVNDYTEPIKILTGYAIYKITEKKPQGFLNFDSIKVAQIKPKVIIEKKAEVLSSIAKDIQSKISGGDLMALKEQYPQYIFGHTDSVSVSKPEGTIGLDHAVYGAIFKMNPGEVSQPLKGTKGIILVKLNSVIEFNEQDYVLKAPDIRNTLLGTKRQQIVSDWLTKMQNEAKIIDNRDKYF